MGPLRQAAKKYDPNSGQLHLEAGSSGESSDLGARNHDATLSALISRVDDNRVRRILQMIESHPSCKIQRLALECNLSESRLQHLFKQRTGLGLGQLLTEQRLLQATDFLERTSLSIKEIATIIGYEHATSFTRAFERRFQQAPSCYRQAQSACRHGTKSP